MDELVIKSRTEDEVVSDIEETFKTLRKINMKLNPKKCTFGVEEGMFLGYQVNTKGIKICPDMVDTVLSLQSPKCLKDVQKLNGKFASLNRILAKSEEKSLPFFKTLKKCTKKSDFLWMEEAEAAFKQMKEHIAKLPMLTAPEEQEELIVYLAASKEAVSAVLIVYLANANLLCQPGAEGPRIKLHLHGKIGASTSTCKQKAKKILPSIPNHSNNGSTNQKHTIKPKSCWASASRLYHRKTKRRKPGRFHKGGRTAPGTMDPVHER
ncbi:reverse transcriptase domain-containing protein, partial [Tanacetum coccineum]